MKRNYKCYEEYPYFDMKNCNCDCNYDDFFMPCYPKQPQHKPCVPNNIPPVCKPIKPKNKCCDCDELLWVILGIIIGKNLE